MSVPVVRQHLLASGHPENFLDTEISEVIESWETTRSLKDAGSKINVKTDKTQSQNITN